MWFLVTHNIVTMESGCLLALKVVLGYTAKITQAIKKVNLCEKIIIDFLKVLENKLNGRISSLFGEWFPQNNSRDLIVTISSKSVLKIQSVLKISRLRERS